MIVVESRRVQKGTGEGFVVRRGQVFRVRMTEGKQVGDMTFVSLDDVEDGFCDIATSQFNGQSFSRAEILYGSPPKFRHMATVTHDRIGVHFLQGRCSWKMYEFHHGQKNARGCHENLVDAFAQLGIDEKHVPYGTFNIFMNMVYEPNGKYHFALPIAEAGEYVDFRAEIDLAIGLSACPYNTIVNDNDPKPLDVDILEPDPKDAEHPDRSAS